MTPSARAFFRVWMALFAAYLAWAFWEAYR